MDYIGTTLIFQRIEKYQGYYLQAYKATYDVIKYTFVSQIPTT